MSILDILDEIAADNSRLHKEAVLKREKNNFLLQRVIKAAYDPFINYWQIKIPEYTPSKNPTDDLEDVLDVELPFLAQRGVTGGDAKDYLAETLSNLSAEDAEVVERIIKHDLRAGFSGSTANKIWVGIIPTFDVCLAHKDISGIHYPAYAQIKYDGGRCHLHFDGTDAKAWSRNGKEIQFHGALNNFARKLMKAGETWDGEIVFRNPKGQLLDRKTSNGLFNKGVKNTISPEEAQFATFISWDIVDFTESIPYKQRIETMGARWEALPKEERTATNADIWVVESVIVKSEVEAQEFYENCIKHKHEGAILKNMTMKWQPKRIKDIGKMKGEEEADLLVTGWFPGKPGTKYENGLGGLEYTTADGLIGGNVGSGFSDDIRLNGDYDSWVGAIITVRYNQRIKSSGAKKESLFLARFIERRWDKNVANTADELK